MARLIPDRSTKKMRVLLEGHALEYLVRVRGEGFFAGADDHCARFSPDRAKAFVFPTREHAEAVAAALPFAADVLRQRPPACPRCSRPFGDDRAEVINAAGERFEVHGECEQPGDQLA